VPLALAAIKPVGTAGFLDRRELIAVNIGGVAKALRGGPPVGPHRGPKHRRSCAAA
jgi:4-deoxy-L-threo-5-hexosulose-uronate ketol-isomerase